MKAGDATPDGFPIALDQLLPSIIELLKGAKAVLEVETLLGSKVVAEVVDYDNWNGGVTTWGLRLELELHLFQKLEAGRREALANRILEVAQDFFGAFDHDHLSRVLITPRPLEAPPNWQETTHSWVESAGAPGRRQGGDSYDSPSMREPSPGGVTNEELANEMEAQRSLMVAVATGGPKIQEVNADYTRRRVKIARALGARSLKDPNPHRDLWAWYGKWRSDLPTYAARRDYLLSLYGPTVDRLRGTPTAPVSVEPTGWARVDRAIDEARERLAAASTEEQFQAVGLFCREALISMAQELYDPQQHPSTDGIAPSEVDAKRMFDAYLETTASGGAAKNLRKHARSAFDLALELQHKRTATFRDGALCAEATTAVVNILAIIAGRRDPS